MKMKTCSSCETPKDICNYHKKSQSPDGHTNKCKDCCKLYSAKWRSENKDKLREDKARDYQNNKDKYKDRASTWKMANRDKATASNAKRRANRASATTNFEDKAGMYKLARRLNDLTASDLHVDHIEPLVHPDVCGLHTGVNFQLLSSNINAKKGNRRDYLAPMDKLTRHDPKNYRRYPQAA